jgi:adenylyl-sulfate kinase
MKHSVIWLTGLSGSGKSTIANALVNRLKTINDRVINLDGDKLRTRLNSNLGFSEQDRTENIRRTSEVAKLFNDEGFVVICSLISPLKKHREMAKRIIGEDVFKEVFVYCSLNECIRRDPKGLYKTAIINETPNFTGLTAPYEEPENAHAVLTTETMDVESCVNHILNSVKLSTLMKD